MSLYSQEFQVSFGDCDPAGIVFYPNFYRWMDATFHGFLRARGPGHKALCAKLGAMGLGLMETGMTFRAPCIDGDRLDMRVQGIDWSARSYRIAYSGLVDARLVVEGFETRGMFIWRDGALRAGPVAPLRAMLGLADGA